MHKSQSLFYLTTALHVSAVTITHLQEHKTTVTTASGNRYTVMLSAAIVKKKETLNHKLGLQSLNIIYCVCVCVCVCELSLRPKT